MKAEQFEIDLGKKLQKLREEKGKTQAEVAEDLSLNSRETVKQWESWDRHIKARDLYKLAQYYGVSADYLLGISDIESQDPDVKAICGYTGLNERIISQTHNNLFNSKMQIAEQLIAQILNVILGGEIK